MQTIPVTRLRIYLCNVTVCISILFLFFACRNGNRPPDKDVVKKSESLDERTSRNLEKLLSYASENNARLNDSVRLTAFQPVNTFYQNNNFQTVWSREGKWEPAADSFFHVLNRAREYGLFPADYNAARLFAIREKVGKDSLSARDAILWTSGDILLTDAFLNMAKHLKFGRIGRDSISLRRDSLINDDFFISYLNDAVGKNNVIKYLHNLEPKYSAYHKIKNNIKNFIDSAAFANYTYISYPYKDSLAFIKAVKQRLSEEGVVAEDIQQSDSIALAGAIKEYQQRKNLKPTGKITEALIRSLNNTDLEKFKGIALNLDRYKSLPDTLPKTHVLVNIPSYSLYVYEKDTFVLRSKVIVGSPKTKTPLLNSYISNFITYPQWTVPYSIIFKEMLPQIKKNIYYLEKQNLMVVDRYDNVVDPSTINWSELNDKRFPYLIRQREGDDNSLGVIKFNFPNKYSVYLHDTNARWMFAKSGRALSHGCVRVQDWEALSHFLVRSDTIRYPPDTLRAWIERQEKHTVSGFSKVPLFIRYNTVEGGDRNLRFYDDIYGYDRILKEKYFANKSLEGFM